MFAEEAFHDKFVDYLNSTGRKDVVENGYFKRKVTNFFYPADDVEKWLIENRQSYGGFPSDGYTLLVANLTGSVPSMNLAQYKDFKANKTVDPTPHYYNKTFTDMDLGLEVRRRFMTAWGGHERFYFIDLSAGPSNWTNQLPIQLAIGENNVDPRTGYGSRWLAQYLADYILGVVDNLVVPDFVYAPKLASRYSIRVLVVDNRTDQKDLSINKTVNPKRITEELGRLLSFAQVEVRMKFANVTDYPELTQIVIDATHPKNASDIVDARPIYEWFGKRGKNKITELLNLNATDDEQVIPVVAFAFSGDRQLGFTFKEKIRYHPMDDDGLFDRGIWGVALEDMALVGHSSKDFVRGNKTEPRQPGKGFGFTNTIIHEVGHMLGLPHPFQNDKTQDFVASVMAYYPYESSYSQFDIDAILRGHADQLLIRATQSLSKAKPVLINSANIVLAQSNVEAAELYYAKMNYTGATLVALRAAKHAITAEDIGNSPLIIPVLVVASLTVGFTLARMFRKRQLSR